jgi:phospholipid transport system substrate-binding protein
MTKYFQVRGLCALLMLAAATAAIGAVPANPDPLAQMKREVAEVVAVFQDPRMPLAARREKLRQLAAQYFDFEDMAKSTLGYQWRDLTPAQRAEFVPVFTSFIEDAYLSKLQDYTVQKVQEEAKTAVINFTGERFDSADYAEVSSSIVLHDQRDPIVIGYLLHRVDGVWRVYDLTVYAISIIANYRNQFNRVIASEGFDQLVADLKAKQKQLQQYMEHPPSANPSANHAEK